MNSLIDRLFKFKRHKYKELSTNELDPSRGDALVNWRERPSELDKEITSKFLTKPFPLWKKDEAWLIFSRSYYQFEFPHLSRRAVTIQTQLPHTNMRGRRKKLSSPFHRLPDHIAVNTQTGEIRRFVDIPGNEVLDDLRGIHPAPAQTDLANFWGQRKPSGIREMTRERFRQQFQDEQGIHISKLIHLLPYPFYGPVGNPLDLTLRCNISLSISSLVYLSSVGFVYSRSSQTKTQIELQVSEENTYTRTSLDGDTPEQMTSPFNLARMFFQRYHKDGEEQETIENIDSWQGKLTIAGNLFSSELYHQTQPDQLSWFSLTNEQAKLTGNAHGLSKDELFRWLEMLQIINQQDDILHSYQYEYDEDRRRVETTGIQI